MSEIEQLRKEVNELRERVARLEAKQQPLTVFGKPLQPNILQGVPAVWPVGAVGGTRVRCAITGQDLGSAD